VALAQQAVALDDSLPFAHSLLTGVYELKQQYDQAIAEGERAIALDPNNADSYDVLAEALNFAGRPEETLRAVEQAMRLNPHYPPLVLIRLGLGLSPDWAVCRGSYHAEGNYQPEPQFYPCPLSPG
jgi:tetratricopeptide (TPR) repeat protein